MTKSETPVLEVEGLRKQFGKTTALAGFDLLIGSPGVFGFLGPNGAGKTTTFKLIAGLLRPTAGRVLIDGVDVQRDTRRAVAGLGIQFDAPAFYPYLSGRDNLRVAARWLGLELEARIDELLDTVGLSEAADRGAGGYSWGMKRRLGLASALLSDPTLLLLDEPTSGLDPGGIADIRKLLPRLAHDEGRSVLLSSHRMEEVDVVCDHVTIINRGQIVAAGTPEDLASDDNLIEIHCDKAPAAAKILRGLADIIQVEQTAPNRLEVLAPKIRASRINQFLVDQGITADQIVVRRESLEEVFFRLTGTGDNDVEDAGRGKGKKRKAKKEAGA
jgi:ABC-2 type transport system ATP-binding protein